MTCKDIVIEYLQAHGYQGLTCPDVPCGCGIQDFAPCDGNFSACEPAYAETQRCEDCENKDCEGRFEDGQEKTCYTTRKPPLVTPSEIQDETDADGRVISDADPGL